MPSFVPEIAARAKISKELLGQASLLHCCMHLNPGRVEIALADASSGQIIWGESFLIEARKSDSWEDVIAFVEARNWFEKVFRKCTLAFDTDAYTTVPAAFYEQGRESQLLQFHTGQEHLSADVLPLNEIGAQFIFAIPDEVRRLSSRFPNIRLFPSAWIVLRYSWMLAPQSGSTIYIWHTPGMMDLVFLKDRKLLLARNDRVQSAEDMLYHTSNAAMRLGIDLENSSVSIYSSEEIQAIRRLFLTYCKELRPAEEETQLVMTKMQLSCV